MRTRLVFEWSFGDNRVSEGGSMTFDPEQWAEQADARMREREAARNRQDNTLVVRQGMLETHYPELWKELRNVFKCMCDSFNNRRNLLSFSEPGPGAFTVRRSDAEATVFVERAPGHKIVVSAGNIKDIYIAQVFPSEGDGVVALVTQNGARRSVDEVATKALDHLLS
jgi:hypothetical protein